MKTLGVLSGTVKFEMMSTKLWRHTNCFIRIQKKVGTRLFCANPNLAEQQKARDESEKELILQVDENNEVIGFVTRKEMAMRKSFFRGSSILVFNSKNQLHVHKRALTKHYCGGYFDICAGGIVGKDESNEESAYRELKEELGIDLLKENKKLSYHGCFRHNNFWGNIYSCLYDGDVTIQTTEVDSIHYQTIEEIKKRLLLGNCIDLTRSQH